ncbi:hypothetical protein WJ97_12315 [Burkholderia ubonensis]|nr:hypothetical protein WJ97_12315 [Burkholderia ubonensis]
MRVLASAGSLSGEGQNMSVSSKNSLVAPDGKPVTPARILQRYLGTLIVLLLVTLLVGQLNLPHYGKTAWVLGVDVLSVVFGQYVPLVSRMVASQYAFAAGVLGVVWLTHIYLRVHRTGRYSPRRFDGVMVVLSLYLIVVYFAYWDTVLPFKSSFFSRLALYSAISPVVFSYYVLLLDCVEREREARKAKRSKEDTAESCFGMSVLIGIFVGMATGFHGCSDDSVSFFGFQFVNAVLHLLANLISMGVAEAFVEVVRKHAASLDKPEDGHSDDARSSAHAALVAASESSAPKSTGEEG